MVCACLKSMAMKITNQGFQLAAITAAGKTYFDVKCSQKDGRMHGKPAHRT